MSKHTNFLLWGALIGGAVWLATAGEDDEPVPVQNNQDPLALSGYSVGAFNVPRGGRALARAVRRRAKVSLRKAPMSAWRMPRRVITMQGDTLALSGYTVGDLGFSLSKSVKKVAKKVRKVGRKVSAPVKKLVGKTPIVGAVAKATAKVLRKVDSKFLKPGFDAPRQLAEKATLDIRRTFGHGSTGHGSSAEEVVYVDEPGNGGVTQDNLQQEAFTNESGIPMPMSDQWTDQQAQTYDPQAEYPADVVNNTVEPYAEADDLEQDEEGSNTPVPASFRAGILAKLDADIRSIIG